MIPPPVGGLNYYELALERCADGKIRAVNMYAFATAEFISQAARRDLLPVLASDSGTPLDKLPAADRDFLADLPTLRRLAAMLSAGNFQEGMVLLKELRSETRKQKFALLLQIKAAQSIGGDVYFRAIDEIRRLYPEDPCLEFLAFNYHKQKRDFAAVLQSVDRLDKLVGGDPYLDVLRAIVLEEKDDRPGAKRYARRAMGADPTWLAPYYIILHLSLKDQNHDETLRQLKVLDADFSIPFKNLSEQPEFSRFAKSPQYREWIEYLKRQAKGE